MKLEVIIVDNENKLVIKAKGEDGYKTFSVRIREDIVEDLDKVAAQSGYSRNALIGDLLRFALDNCKIEK